jgi:hypothetical protein
MSTYCTAETCRHCGAVAACCAVHPGLAGTRGGHRNLLATLAALASAASQQHAARCIRLRVPLRSTAMVTKQICARGAPWCPTPDSIAAASRQASSACLLAAGLSNCGPMSRCDMVSDATTPSVLTTSAWCRQKCVSRHHATRDRTGGGRQSPLAMSTDQRVEKSAMDRGGQQNQLATLATLATLANMAEKQKQADWSSQTQLALNKSARASDCRPTPRRDAISDTPTSDLLTTSARCRLKSHEATPRDRRHPQFRSSIEQRATSISPAHCRQPPANSHPTPLPPSTPENAS